jgi:hypothetical protein
MVYIVPSQCFYTRTRKYHQKLASSVRFMRKMLQSCANHTVAKDAGHRMAQVVFLQLVRRGDRYHLSPQNRVSQVPGTRLQHATPSTRCSGAGSVAMTVATVRSFMAWKIASPVMGACLPETGAPAAPTPCVRQTASRPRSSPRQQTMRSHRGCCACVGSCQSLQA